MLLYKTTNISLVTMAVNPLTPDDLHFPHLSLKSWQPYMGEPASSSRWHDLVTHTLHVPCNAAVFSIFFSLLNFYTADVNYRMNLPSV